MMPGIELLDYIKGDPITAELRDRIISAVHGVLEDINGKRPKHTTFRYSPSGPLDVSCFDDGTPELDHNGYDYILVVDGERTAKTMEAKEEIRSTIKVMVAGVLNIRSQDIAVRYRVHDSSFG